MPEKTACRAFPCDCPASGGWEITGSLQCVLSANCLLNGALHINNGTLAIPNGKTLVLSSGNKIIIGNAATSKLIVENGGKLVLNKAGN